MEGLKRLARRHPWPAEPPDVPDDWHGWLGPETARALAEHLSARTRLVVECGSWLGVSARAILELAPGAALVCVDHWQGSPEHYGNPEWAARLPRLYATFLRNLWPYRQRVIPLVADSLDGLAEVAAQGLSPELVYLDTEHSFARVGAELAFCTNHWPQAAVVGDDFNNPAVSRAAEAHAQHIGRRLLSYGAAFCFPPAMS